MFFAARPAIHAPAAYFKSKISVEISILKRRWLKIWKNNEQFTHNNNWVLISGAATRAVWSVTDYSAATLFILGI